MRKTIFVIGEYYHVYNRGIDRRTIFENRYNLERFLQSMSEFNTLEPIGSIFESRHSKLENKTLRRPIISLIAYCLNPNHYHFLLTPLVEKGVQKYMHRLGTGYTMYFNEKYHRTGSLFQGRFKAIHVNTNEYLLRLSAYINLNSKVHHFGGRASKMTSSSFDEYVSDSTDIEKPVICDKEIILEQFKSKSDYRKFALDALEDTLRNKDPESETDEFGG